MLRHCQITSPVQWLELVYHWSKRSVNGELVEIRPDGRFAVNHAGFLIILDIRQSDSGLYRVNISNSQGSALHTVQLRVTRLSTLCMHAQNLMIIIYTASGDIIILCYSYNYTGSSVSIWRVAREKPV